MLPYSSVFAKLFTVNKLVFVVFILLHLCQTHNTEDLQLHLENIIEILVSYRSYVG